MNVEDQSTRVLHDMTTPTVTLNAAVYWVMEPIIVPQLDKKADFAHNIRTTFPFTHRYSGFVAVRTAA